MDYKTLHEYQLILKAYGERKAERSGVLYMNHIDEGLDVLVKRESTVLAMRAYCIHPLVQADQDLLQNFGMLKSISGEVVALAMEYRRVANAYLSTRKIERIEEIELSPLEDVNEMLRADKVQNFKDFVLYHKGTHPRSDDLDLYFDNWFCRLKIDASGKSLTQLTGAVSK